MEGKEFLYFVDKRGIEEKFDNIFLNLKLVFIWFCDFVFRNRL